MLDLSSISPGFDSEFKAFSTLLDNGFSTPSLANPPAPGSTTNSGSTGGGIVGGAMNAAGTLLFGLSITRMIAIILGLIFIIAALFLFKGPAVIETVKSSAKDALLS